MRTHSTYANIRTSSQAPTVQRTWYTSEPVLMTRRRYVLPASTVMLYRAQPARGVARGQTQSWHGADEQCD